jgi:hypothetical protein
LAFKQAGLWVNFPIVSREETSFSDRLLISLHYRIFLYSLHDETRQMQSVFSETVLR